MLNLRDYQHGSLDALRNGFAVGKRAQILYAPTGAGKTEMAIALLDATKRKNNKAAMLLDRIILCDQTSQRLEKYSIDHGVLQSGHWRYRPYENIQVCSAQTIEKRGAFPGLKLLIVDECFPAGTMISTPSGPKPIQLVRCGDLVHNATGVGRVMQTMVRPALHLTRLEFDDGTVIECTNEHPILTARGWKRAESLEIGEGTFSKQGMRLLWQTIFSKHQRGEWKKSGDVTRGSLERASHLLGILRKEAGKSDEQRGGASQGQGKAARNSPQADQEGWQRSVAAVTSTCFAPRPGRGVGVGVCGGDQDATPQDWIPNLLQAGLSLPGEKDRHRVRRWQSLLTGEASARFEEDRVLHFPRVVNISRVQPGGFEAVFNLHVDGHPSYFAEGKLVHNCHAMRKQTVEFIKNNPEIMVIGLTATPFTKGLGKVYDNVVSVVTTRQLVEQGVLCPLRVFVAKEIDMEGAKKVAGEWSQDEAQTRGMKITGDVVSEWIKKTYEIFGKPVKTIVFSSGVEHAADLAAKFGEAGFNFVSISYRDDDKFKRDVIEDFSKPDTEIHGLIATDILTKGFDVPDVLIGVSARPFSKSLSSHIQQMGRVMRGSQGKDFAVWLDHSGNYLRFREDWEEIFENGVHELNDQKEKAKKEKTKAEKEAAKCPACGALWPGNSDTCTHCGHVRQRKNKVTSVAGEMEELTSGASRETKQDWWAMCQYMVRYHGWSPGRAAHTYRDKYGVWPRGLNDHMVVGPSTEFQKFVKAKLIRYLKGKGA